MPSLPKTPTDYAIQLRDHLVVVLAAELGTYTWEPGTTAPAIRVEDGSVTDRGTPTVEGLEVVLQPSVASTIVPILRGYQEKLMVRVTCKQWDLQRTIEDVLRLLLDDFSATIEGITRVPRNTRLDTIDTLTVTTVRTITTHF